jgi:DNA-binding MarR family transcriptional regulator
MNRSAGSSRARDGRAPGANGPARADEAAAEEHELADKAAAEAPEAEAAPEGREDELALGVAAGIERLLSLLRWLTPPDGLSFTAAATLATLDRSGPSRLTLLAVNEGVTQPAMTQLVARLLDAGLIARASDPSDRRVVEVSITAEGSALLSRRRAARAGGLARMLARLSPEDQAALAAALPAMEALTGQREPNVGERSKT